jgi:multidrug efflux system membrane fusion protein
LHDVVTVPNAAVQQGAPGSYVYLVNKDNTVSVRPVKLGSSDQGMVEVQSGLEVGDRVVTDGTDRLSDGAHVTIPGDTQSNAETPPSNDKKGNGRQHKRNAD